MSCQLIRRQPYYPALAQTRRKWPMLHALPMWIRTCSRAHPKFWPRCQKSLRHLEPSKLKAIEWTNWGVAIQPVLTLIDAPYSNEPLACAWLCTAGRCGTTACMCKQQQLGLLTSNHHDSLVSLLFILLLLLPIIFLTSIHIKYNKNAK